MAWFRVDDKFPRHPKVMAAAAHLGGHTGRVLAVWLEAGCYCSEHATDGLVPLLVARSFLSDRKPVDVLKVMARPDVGMMIEMEAGFQFHDWLHYQPSAAEVKAKREADRARKRGGIQSESNRNPIGIHAESVRIPERSRARVPSHPQPDPDPQDDAHTDLEPVWAIRGRSALIASPLRHAKCYPSPACERGLCVPGFLGDQWQAQVGGDAAKVQAVILAALEGVSGPIGHDPLSWWRGQWARAHGRAGAAPAASRRPIGEWSDECKRVHGADGDGRAVCGNQHIHHARMTAVSA